MTDGIKVQFLVAGVQKGGTTSLFDYLRQHPRLQLANCKEVHFFDNDSQVDWSKPDYAFYHAAFETPDGRLRGEVTPIYLYWPNSLERIATYNPDIRIILLFRDPVQRAWSHWRMEFARGSETEPFAWAIRDGRRRVAEDNATPGWHRVFSYVERGFYGRQYQRLLAMFPSRQVLPLRSYDLKHEPDATLRQVCRFLDVEELEGFVCRRELNVGIGRNGGAMPRDEDAHYLNSLYAEDLALFQELSGLIVKEATSLAAAQSDLAASFGRY